MTTVNTHSKCLTTLTPIIMYTYVHTYTLNESSSHNAYLKYPI